MNANPAVMGGASRFIMLLTTPFPFLLHRPRSSLLRLARHSRLSSSLSPHYLTPQLSFPIKVSQQIHTQTSAVREDRDTDSLGFSPNAPASHPWPEWSKLIHSLSESGYFDHHRLAIQAEDEFVAIEEFSDEFLRASAVCLAFSRDRSDLLGSLSRRDIGVIVENGTPFLFKSALDTARRMRAFLGISAINAFESDKAHTVDLMKYLLSYASNPTVSSERGNLYQGQLVESSVRNLLSELSRLGCGVPAPEPSASVQHQFPDGYGQTPRPLGQKIEMKRGDWICPRCSFMNFARNFKCLECEEARPKRQLTGGEWECPQCDFFNYGRNLVCLRCDCKRPGDASFGTSKSSSASEYANGVHANKPDIESRLAANEEKAQRWFSKLSQLDSASDLSSAAADEDFPEIMPMRKGVNRFVVSTRKTPLERRLANSQYQRNDQTGSVSAPISQSLDEILGRKSAVSDVDKKNFADGQNAGTKSSLSESSSASPQYGHPKSSNSSYVPFVPLPDDMFAKKPQKMEGSEKAVTESIESVSLKFSEQTSTVSASNESGKLVDSLQLSEKPSNQVENSEQHDAPDLASPTSDEDFPEIMPMRKGENRFVVSKKKDRSLTSPMYKRRMAMEQSGSTNFVPFVPFPPDYFAKKDKQQPDGAVSTAEDTGETSLGSTISQNSENNRPWVSDINHVQRMENQHNSTRRLNLESSGENLNERKPGITSGSSSSGNLTENSFNSESNNQDDWSTQFSGKESRIERPNLTGNPTQQPENQNVRSGWTGKSLEGSAVQEPDPLDMSEEAKAQRWYRRVAQIKDISELSKIPDEDFPSIMPMRKGVNRFVVSKRKTPLERRLTSQQYRRNLPIVSSDPVKKENEGS
ncbi:unnamed protein product [Camellia sinensis]